MIIINQSSKFILLSIVYLAKFSLSSPSPLLGNMLGSSGEEVDTREGSIEQGGDMTRAGSGAEDKKGSDSGNLIINTGASSQGNYPPYYQYPPPYPYHPHYYPYPYPYPPPQQAQQIGPFQDTKKFNFQYVNTK